MRLALKYAYESAPNYMLIRIVLMILQSLLPLVPLYLIKLLVDGLTEDMSLTNHIVYVIVAFGIVRMLIIVINNYAAYCTEIQAQEIANHVSQLMIDKAARIEYANHENVEYNDSFDRATSQATTLPAEILTQMMIFLQHSLTMVTLMVFLFTMHWVITAIIILSAIPVALVKIYFSKEKWELFYKNTTLRRESGYLYGILTMAGSAKELHVFGFSGRLKTKFGVLIRELLNRTKKLAAHTYRTVTMIQILDVVALIVAIYFISKSTLDGQISIGSMVMFYQGFIKAQSTLSQLFQSSISLYYKRLFFADFMGFMNTPEREIREVDSVQIKNIQNDGLVVNGVHFTYPGSTAEVLSEIDVRLPSRGMTAIVGKNGSGKSSLIKLICQLYQPTKGRIHYGGQKMSYELVQKEVSALFQDFVHFEFDVKENILLSRPNDPLDQAAFDASLNMSEVEDMINELSDGLDTPLGKSFHKGTILSGGQWQRIALARALYKNASLYILDEPTSFIDPYYEPIIMKNIRALANNSQVILVTHKLYNLKTVDHVIVLDEGRMMSQGTYQNVYADCALFREMVRAQSIE